MVSAHNSRRSWLRSEIDHSLNAFRLWRQKSLVEKIIDIFCAALLAGFMFILIYLIMLSSEYGGNG